MNLRKLLCVASLAICCVPRLAWATSPTDTVKQLLDAMRSYKAANGGTNANAQQVVDGAVPIQDLAKQVLGGHWAKLNATEQKSFIQLLRDLLQKVAYPKSAEFFGDLKIAVVNESVTGSEAVVETMVSHPKEGQVTIEYKLHQAGERWTVNDVLLDGVSLVTNVRTQMQQVITKESYQGLLKRMREKLTES